jgi:hypothetical protein
MHNQDARCKMWLAFEYASTQKDYFDWIDHEWWNELMASLPHTASSILKVPETTNAALKNMCYVPDRDPRSNVPSTCSADARLATCYDAAGCDEQQLVLDTTCKYVQDNFNIRRRNNDTDVLLRYYNMFTLFKGNPFQCNGTCQGAGATYVSPGINIVMGGGAHAATYMHASPMSDALAKVRAAPNGTSKWYNDIRWMDLWIQAKASAFEEAIQSNYALHAKELESIGLVRQALEGRAHSSRLHALHVGVATQ